MLKQPEQVSEFLSNRNIGVAGVSRDPNQAANAVYRRLRASGHRVFAINPSTSQVEGDPCYPDIGSIPETLEAVVIATHPNTAVQVVRECVSVRNSEFDRCGSIVRLGKGAFQRTPFESVRGEVSVA